MGLTKFLSLIIFVVLAVNIVNASSLEISSEIVNIAEPGNEALYKVTIFNKQSIEDTFKISADEFATTPFSDVFEYIDIGETEVFLLPKQSKAIEVKVKILREAIPNKNYRTFLRVESIKNPRIYAQHTITVNVLSPKNIVVIGSTLPKQIVPGKPVSFDLNLENVANLILKDVDFAVESDIFRYRFTKSVPFDIPGKEEIVINLDSGIKPGIYTLNVKAVHKGKQVGSFVQEFEVSRNPDIKEKIETKPGMLVDRITLKKTNQGNVFTEEKISVELSGFQRIVTRYSVAPTGIGDGRVEWSFGLEPGETFEVLVVTDYRSLLILTMIVIVGVLLLMYFMTRRVSLTKEVFKVKGEGGITELKIMLHIKNMGDKVDSVVITDLLPNIIKPKHEKFGTLKPSKMQKSDKAIRIIWDISSLMKREERIISYEVQSALPIIGRITLPAATVRYKKGDKQLTAISNRAVFHS